MTLRRLCLPILAVTVGAAVASAQPTACPQFFPGGQPPALLNPRLAQRATLLCNDAYAALASGVTRGAIWSAERPTAASVSIARTTERWGQFHSEDRLPPADQAQLDDYRGSGFDRGHMTPSGDMPGERAQQQTFSLANMVPQTPELNRGVWTSIEMGVRNLAARDGELYVVTGPAFQGQQIGSIGRSGVLVPSSTWKAVYDPQASGTGAYICENTTTPSCRTMSVVTLATMVGIDPFPAVPAGMKQIAMPLPEDGRSSSSRHRKRRRESASVLEQLFPR